MRWLVEERRNGKAVHYIAEHSSGAELHVWLSEDMGDYGAAKWHYEIKGRYTSLNSPFPYEAKSLEFAKAEVVQLIKERIDDLVDQIVTPWEKQDAELNRARGEG